MAPLPRILLVNPYLLIDTTNGATVSQRALAHELTSRGYACQAVSECARTEYSLSKSQLLEQVKCTVGVTCQPGRLQGLPIYRIQDRRVTEIVLAPERNTPRRVDRAQRFARLVELTAKAFQPSLAMVLFADHILPPPVVDVFARLNLPVMLFVQTVSALPSPAQVRTSSMVVSCSHYAAKAISRRLKVPVRTAHLVMPAERYLAVKRKPTFVTFINPIPEKGLAFVLRLMAEAQQHLPEARFLIVESRGTRRSTEALGIDWKQFSNVEFEPNRKDMRSTYARTQVLLFPSLWPEAFGMCLVEAQSNGIPVLATNVGGIPEALNKGGMRFDVPPRFRRHWRKIPTAVEMRPWLNALRRLVNDRKHYDTHSKIAARAAKDFAPRTTVPQCIRLIDELLATAENGGPHTVEAERLAPRGTAEAPRVARDTSRRGSGVREVLGRAQ